MESKKINQLATELTPALSDLTIIGDPTTGISKKITLSQMASLFTGTVEEYANLASFPLVGVADTIYIALDTNVLYRWDTGLTSYVELSPNIINSLVFSDANGFDGTISLVGSVATLTITTALTTGSVPFIGASGALSQDNANFFFDDTNNRLGINTNAPTTALDAFGSGIIGRLNGTSTNNAFLGFASAGTNKWSIGNVQSDHRFRIYNEATTSELVSVLSTGEFGIGIANPTTKFHIDGAASALIANLDANVSVAKSISFRSDNSARINLEVSGTESGSNAGANLFINRYSDAGALIDTALQITRSTGVTTVKQLGILTSNNTYFQFNTTNATGAYGTFEVSGSVYGDIGYGTQLFTGGATSFGINARDSRSLILGTNQAIRLTIDSSGKIGIGTGTATLSYLLSFGGDVATTIGMNQSTLGTAPALTLRGADSATGTNNEGGAIYISSGLGTGSGSTSQIVFSTAPSVGSGTTRQSLVERMKLTASGQLQMRNSGGTQVNALSASGWGYSITSYPVLLIGQNASGGGNSSLAFNVDISGNPSGAFSGDGSEYLWRNTGSFKTPNSSNNGYNTLFNWNNNGVLIRIEDTYIGSSTIDKGSRLVVYGQSTNSSFYAIRCFSSGSDVLFQVRNDGIIQTGLSSGSPYNNTSGAAANMVVSSGGTLERSIASSIRFKENINEWNESGLNTILALKPKTFTYKADYYKHSEIEFLGLIAEEVAEVNPYFADYENQDRTGQVENVRYSYLTVPLIKAVQELKAEIEQLKALINK